MQPNPSLKREHQQRGTLVAKRGGLRPHVVLAVQRATLSVPLARTLGFRKATAWCFGRKCACRRELKSHDEAKPLTSAPDDAQW
jgi:hypothetical protein